MNMQQVIIIPTSHKYKPWLLEFLKTYNHSYPIILVFNDANNNQYDAKAVIEGIKYGFDEFLVLHDTMEIKDNAIFDIIFQKYKGESIELVPMNTMFMLKYTKKHLDLIPKQYIDELFAVNDKWSAVVQEAKFSRVYEHYAHPIVLFPFLDRAALNPHEFKHGRDNMIMENNYIKKYKGSWDMPTLQAADKYIPTD